MVFEQYSDPSTDTPSTPPRMDSHAWTMTGRQERYKNKICHMLYKNVCTRMHSHKPHISHSSHLTLRSQVILLSLLFCLCGRRDQNLSKLIISLKFRAVFLLFLSQITISLHLQGVGPQEYTLIKMKIVEPYTAKFKSKVFYSR